MKVVDRRWWARQQAGETDAGAEPSAQAEDAPRLKPTYVEELEQQLAERDRQLQDVLTKYREASREFDDARARLRKEIAKDIERGRRTILLELLDVVDNLDRAIEAGRATHAGDPLLEGVVIVRDQFLAKLGGFRRHADRGARPALRPVVPRGGDDGPDDRPGTRPRRLRRGAARVPDGRGRAAAGAGCGGAAAGLSEHPSPAACRLRGLPPAACRLPPAACRLPPCRLPPTAQRPHTRGRPAGPSVTESGYP